MEVIKVKDINLDFTVRPVTDHGVAMVQEKIENLGYMEEKPIVVDDEMLLICGHHRVRALLNIGTEEVPAIVKSGLTDFDRKKLAFNSNESEGASPVTFVDYAHFIWGETGQQKEIADILGWSKPRISQYNNLKKITTSAWAVICHAVCSVNEELTTVIFTENLLRPIIKLEPCQQDQLVKALADEPKRKGEFKRNAELYRQQNKDADVLLEQLDHTGDEFINEGLNEIATGKYDLEKLIDLLLEKFNKVNQIQLINGDFMQEVDDVDDCSVDLIITDPPYNISIENDIELKDRTPMKRDLGEWDKHEHTDFIQLIDRWVASFYRILKPHQSCYIWCAGEYLSFIMASMKKAGFEVRTSNYWHKTNPGTCPSKRSYISSVECCAYGVKDSFNPETTFNFFGDDEMHNHLEGPLCGGDERIKSESGATLHPTQKPLYVIEWLAKRSSNVGDLIFDGFMGVGTTASVCKKLNRRFKGVEIDKAFFKAAQRRLKNVVV